MSLRCAACGTEFVATDGSSPPPAPKPTRSPIAPTESLPPLETTERARGFTSDVRVLADGRRLVTCPQCRHAEIEVPRRATVAEIMRCPQCRGTFLVGLRAASEDR
ncbi:TFIIB-type zinc ribbon-containing protein [Frigoriglobus tundricola]|uniref:Transcription factor zinc-finger domain-containing protein n=1 Tax=Frigoriglobus tundricola TaxID=2774151 RepID=A0A6M5Z370_9BACT|nr:zf-TFIIB domain-containing protein [Frigoriglobus tundricola]QJX00868.1 hypothetical protein FTUN_8506 [Frigoriglobus tundricola]